MSSALSVANTPKVESHFVIAVMFLVYQRLSTRSSSYDRYRQLQNNGTTVWIGLETISCGTRQARNMLVARLNLDLNLVRKGTKHMTDIVKKCMKKMQFKSTKFTPTRSTTLLLGSSANITRRPGNFTNKYLFNTHQVPPSHSDSTPATTNRCNGVQDN